jgi:hypothetical protein
MQIPKKLNDLQFLRINFSTLGKFKKFMHLL